VRLAALAAPQRAEVEVAMHVVEVEVARAERRADVPRSRAVAAVHGAGRLAQLVAAAVGAEIALVVGERERAADQCMVGQLVVAARRDRIHVGVT
jgi:hypothetical protein